MDSVVRGLLRRICLYYVVLFAALIILSISFPQVLDFVPDSEVPVQDEATQLENALFDNPSGNTAINFINQRAVALLVALVSTVLFTIPLAWTYNLSNPQTKQHRFILETIFMLPITVASVVIIVQNSIALAFSLAGIVAAVRFRSNIDTPADAVFVFAAIAIGLAAGVSEIGVAWIGSMFFCFAFIVLRFTPLVHGRSLLTGKKQAGQPNSSTNDS